MAGDTVVKQARAIGGWTEVSDRESELVRRCAVRDEDACAELVHEHQRMVYHLAMHLLGDRDEALDLSQEVFLRVFRTIHDFRGQSALRTWIYRIVVNQAHNRRRWRVRRRVSDQISLHEHMRSHGDLPILKEGDGPDDVLVQKQIANQIWKAVDELPFDQRTAVILREVEGLSYEEIAFSLNTTVGAVKSRLARARQSLREHLRNLSTS